MLDRDIIRHAKETGFHLTLERTLPSGVEFYQLEELKFALTGADLIIGGVSSFGVDWFGKDILTLLPSDVPVLSVTKGMLSLGDGSFISYPRFYSSIAPGRDFCAIGGPCTSYELADLDNTYVGFCGRNMDSLERMKNLLETSFYHISLTTDIEGFECAVALKNVYALAVTLAVGLSLRKGDIIHYNSQAAIFAQSIREMRRLLSLWGYDDDNVIYGAGDLYVTVFGGRTRKLGTLLGMGHDFESAIKELSGVTLESVVIASRTGEAVSALVDMGKASKEEFPLLFHIYEIIKEGIKADIPWKSFG